MSGKTNIVSKIALAALCALVLILGFALGESSPLAGGQTQTDSSASNAIVTSQTQESRRQSWLEVSGTTVSVPVVQAAEDAPDFYLSHDQNGNKSPLGCAFIDARVERGSLLTVIYGHNQIGGSGMFSPLRRMPEQALFDTLKNATLWDGTGKKRTYYPVCALKIDAGNTDIQRFDIADVDELKPWLHSFITQATAKRADTVSQSSSVKRVLALITCSSARPHQRERTLVLFAQI